MPLSHPQAMLILVDERLEAHCKAFDAYIEAKAAGQPLSDEQKAVLAYLIKSEWENEQYFHTILLTPDNNHFQALLSLERHGLISKHHMSSPIYPIYAVDRTLMQRDYHNELQHIFGQGLVGLDPTLPSILNMMYRHHLQKSLPGGRTTVRHAVQRSTATLSCPLC